MRTTQALVPFCVAGVTVMLSVASAQADPVSGSYDVKYEEISTNCGDKKLTYPHGKLSVEVKNAQLVVNIDRTPVMYGKPGASGKIKAQSRLGDTMMGGMKGVFSVSGRITPEGQLHLVMVGEYSADGKPLCSQTWNVTGPKADPPTRAPKRLLRRERAAVAVGAPARWPLRAPGIGETASVAKAAQPRHRPCDSRAP